MENIENKIASYAEELRNSGMSENDIRFMVDVYKNHIIENSEPDNSNEESTY